MTMSLELTALQSKQFPNWCPGCGDFGIWMAIKQAMVKLNKPIEDYVVVSGIGCGSKTPHWIRTFGFHTLHGRPAPVASGVKLANHDLTVIIVGGDGDGYGIGMGHFFHLLRRNYNLLYIVQDNEVYGLTTGQTSPTTEQGSCTISTPHGALEVPVNPMALSITAGATWVSRGFSGDIPYLTEQIVAGVEHKGMAVLDVLQPCVTFNKKHPFGWYQQRVRKLEDDADYNPEDKLAALAMAQPTPEELPIGLFYRENRPTYEDGLPQLKQGPLVHQSLDNIDLNPLLNRLR
jgi:2-oxoglutarate ferredoxin oxidoreductase subunit beta